MKSISQITRRIKSISLHRKIILSYTFFMFFVLVIVGTILYSITTTFIKSEVSDYMSEVLRQINKNIDYTLNDIQKTALIISADRDVQTILKKDKERPIEEFVSDDDFMSEKIYDVIRLRKDIEGFFIFSYNGEIYSSKSLDNSIRSDYVFTSSRWFSMMKSLNLKTLLLPTFQADEVIGTGVPKKVFMYVHEIDDLETGKPIGYIVMYLDMAVFKDVIEKADVEEYENFIILDNNKTILYHTEEQYISTQFRSSYISEVLQNKTGSIVRNEGDKEVLITYNTSQLTNWTIINSIPIIELYSEIKKLQYYTIVFMVVICMLFVSLIGTGISKSITRPLHKLQKFMKLAEEGQFEDTIPIESDDEIGKLSHSFNNMLTKIHDLIKKVYTTELLKTEAELNALQAQINPHFLYNTLQIMDLIAEAEGVETISNICQSLSKIFRYSISQGKEIVPLSMEIEHVKNYVFIQKTRFKDKFDIVYDIHPDLEKYQVIKLIIQPLVENALFHGVERKRGQCTIEVAVKKEEDNLIITVKDDGIGIGEEQLKLLRDSLKGEILHNEIMGLSKRGIGIRNVNARVKLYFGEEYGLYIDSQEYKGTTMTVVLPAIIYKGDDMNVKSHDR